MFKSQTTFAKAFVAQHKTALTVTTTATATMAFCLWMNKLALQQHNDFLKENGLYDAFYTLSDDPEDM